MTKGKVWGVIKCVNNCNIWYRGREVRGYGWEGRSGPAREATLWHIGELRSYTHQQQSSSTTVVYSILTTSYSPLDESRIPCLDRMRWLNAQHTTLSRLDWQSFSVTNTPDPGKEDVACSEGPQGSQSEQSCGTHAHNIRKVGYPLLSQEDVTDWLE